MDSAA